MRLGWLGGSFDPPHLGHLAIAQAAATHLGLDQVLLAPTGLQPLKHSGAGASFEHRLAMVRLLCDSGGAPLCQPSILDAPNPDGSPNYTVDALDRLQLQLPDAELFALIGADSLADLPRWRSADRLLQLATWVAISRPGYPLPDPLPAPLEAARTSGHLELLTGVDVPVSSTELRALLRRGADCTGLLPPAVLSYIQQHALYR